MKRSRRPKITIEEMQSASAMIEYHGRRPRPFRYYTRHGSVLMPDTTFEDCIPPGFQAEYITEGWNNIVRSVKVADNQDIERG